MGTKIAPRGHAMLEKILFITDCHFPYEDKRAFNLMLKAAEGFKPKHVIILGDFADMYSVSAHDKNPQRANCMEGEVDEVKKGLRKVKELGAKNNVYIGGNHEDRLARYLMQKAPELFGSVSIERVLKLKEMGFLYVPYKKHYKLGKLYITHDTGKAGKNAHQQALDAYHRSIVIGHTHRMGYVVQGDADGDRHVGAMFGWLGDLNKIDYMHNINAVKDWTLGFGTGYLDPKTGFTYLVPVPIVRYTCVVEGKLYKE